MPDPMLPGGNRRHTALTRGTMRGLDKVARRRRPHPYTASLAGDLSVNEGATSPPWAPDEECDLAALRALLGSAGSSDTVLTAFINGSSIGTVTLGSGDTDVTVDFDEPLSTTDLLTVELTTAGAGAANLLVKGKFD